MQAIEKVKDKVAKLLALAEKNSSPEEAKAAILKAREIMAENKLRPDDCVRNEKKTVVKETIGISISRRKYAWGAMLSAIIAAHYCCVSFRRHYKNGKMYEIGFMGLEDDFAICSRIFEYAFDCVSTVSEEIFRESGRKNAEAYGFAFCSGVQDALRKQSEEHQKWGLVMVVPQIVKDAVTVKPTPYGNAKAAINAGNVSAVRRGYEDGLRFDPSSKLESKGVSDPCMITGQ